jgi:hypothetical protein
MIHHLKDQEKAAYLAVLELSDVTHADLGAALGSGTLTDLDVGDLETASEDLSLRTVGNRSIPCLAVSSQDRIKETGLIYAATADAPSWCRPSSAPPPSSSVPEQRQQQRPGRQPRRSPTFASWRASSSGSCSGWRSSRPHRPGPPPRQPRASSTCKWSTETRLMSSQVSGVARKRAERTQSPEDKTTHGLGCSSIS